MFLFVCHTVLFCSTKIHNRNVIKQKIFKQSVKFRNCLNLRMKKGYYLKKDKKNNIILNIFVADFISYLQSLEHLDGWVNLKIYERNEPAGNGLTHEMNNITKTINREIQ